MSENKLDSNKILCEMRFLKSKDEKICYLEENLHRLSKDELSLLLTEASETIHFDLDLIKIVIEFGADPRADDDLSFVRSCGRDDTKIMEFFLENGANINARNGKALEYGIYSGIVMVKFLLNNGIKINDKAINEALDAESDEIIDLFIQAGIDPNLILKILMSRLKHLKKIFKRINQCDPDYHTVIENLD